MKRTYLLGLVLILGLAGCAVNERYDPDPDKHPIEGVLKDVKFCLGGDVNNCRVEFTDGRVICFNNGEGFLFQLNRTNRIYRTAEGTIDSVEIMPDKPR